MASNNRKKIRSFFESAHEYQCTSILFFPYVVSLSCSLNNTPKDDLTHNSVSIDDLDHILRLKIYNYPLQHHLDLSLERS